MLKEQRQKFTALQEQYLDIEHSFKLLQEEKFKAEREAKKREMSLEDRVKELEEDLRRANDMLDEKHMQLKSTAKELTAVQLKNDEFLIELNKVKDELARFVEEFDKKNKEKLEFQATIKSFEEKNEATQREIESLVALNEKLGRSNSEMMEKEQELADGLQSLEAKINELEAENNLLKQNSRDPKIGELMKYKDKMQKEIEILRSKCRQYEVQLEDYDRIIKSLDLHFAHDINKQREPLNSSIESHQLANTNYEANTKRPGTLTAVHSAEKHPKLEKTLKVKLKDESAEIQPAELYALREHTKLLESQNNKVISPDIIAVQGVRRFCGGGCKS
eukprot:TRINITY_DN4828_c0_g1_i1.p1 TRINITY_DN4828_c0_g1~~TRINITY_DN4828_c0_g1_i1.p1  ORF type:complete len:334 (+),score=111.05 TRINITY_DN4828_c0_g1_i1:130-1131(+)